MPAAIEEPQRIGRKRRVTSRNVDAGRPRAPASFDSAQYRGAGADQVVDDDDVATRDVTRKQGARQRALGANLVHEPNLYAMGRVCLQVLMKVSRPFDAPDIR